MMKGLVIMAKSLELIDKVFGKLTVIKKLPSRNGKTYWLCQCECGKISEVQGAHLTGGKIKSCGKCFSEQLVCLNCGKVLTNQQRKYCCIECQQKYQKQFYIEQWRNGTEEGIKKSGKSFKISDTIRNYLLEKANYKCEICGWGEKNPTTGKVPLEIHHKDGNRNNNIEKNFQVLCPNCHALTPNYKYLNFKRYK